MKPKPFYQDESVTIYHGDCRKIVPNLGQVNHIITDPPYGQNTHNNARLTFQNKPRKTIDFASVTADEISKLFGAMSTQCYGWLIATMDWRHVAQFEARPPHGWKFLRFGVWLKRNGMPQMTGDRPAQGWEAIAYLHRDGIKPTWKGGGRAGNYILPKQNGEHPTTKPIQMILSFVDLFTDQGQVILDPFMGSGTTLRAAKDLGRKAIGIEIEERYCEMAAKRMAQKVLDLS